MVQPTTETVANGTQAAIAMAPDVGAVPRAAVPTVTNELVSAINTAGGLAVGEIGSMPVFRVLGASADDALLYLIVTADQVGGYGYFVAEGATSLPEYWNLTGSLDHFMLGAVDDWINTDLAGIQQAPGDVDYTSLLSGPSSARSLRDTCRPRS